MKIVTLPPDIQTRVPLPGLAPDSHASYPDGGLSGCAAASNPGSWESSLIDLYLQLRRRLWYYGKDKVGYGRRIFGWWPSGKVEVPLVESEWRSCCH
ncbi:hypothetical protein AVEN_154655-1 [Araneus ventricosus]|uniref:Uncharacterized protein n=1 Tax=Araneus ventricosus TaxID=182803 RepID=A0A4Y2JQY6_ARAVE|nr:hypothetical protein AVEN_154655-1 [Araneus ventricosus]